MARETDRAGREPWHARVLPEGKEDKSEGTQEMSSPSPSKVCTIRTKYLLSHLEMTSAPHRPPLPLGEGGRTRVARVPLSWQKGQ